MTSDEIIHGAHVEVYKAANHEFRWRVKAANGRKVGDSGEGYFNESDLVSGMELSGNALLQHAEGYWDNQPEEAKNLRLPGTEKARLNSLITQFFPKGAHPNARFGAVGISSTHLPPDWQDRVTYTLKKGAPNRETWRFLTAQQLCEGGDAKWNPCNTTMWVQNFTLTPDYNDAKVRNYAYQGVGVVAHSLTLMQHKSDGTLLYGKIVNELQNAITSKRTAEFMVANCSENISTWGTNPDLMLDVLKTLA